MADRHRILVVDDDESIAELISLYLNKECFETETAEDGETALKKFRDFAPNLVLLDIMLPGIDGYEVCREIRKTSKVPIIMLSAKGEVFDKVLGLELGADDYIVKPFDSKELVARCKAVLRRFSENEAGSGSAPEALPVTAGPDTPMECIEFPDLLINKSNYTLTVKGRKVDMPPKELELLYFFASNPNRVYTRDQLLEKIWGYEYFGDSRTVDVHIKRIRQKIGENERWELATIWGVGYKFEVK